MNINLWGVPVVKENCNYTFSDFDKDTQEYINDYSRIETDSVNVIVNKGSFLEDTKLKKIKDIIQTHALYYRDNIMACTNELEIQSSWLTINHKNSDHPPHMHNHTIFSICYYPRVESGELVLVAPNNGKNSFQNDYKFGFQYTHYNEWNSSNWSIPVISGDVVVFPGYLTHFSTPNKHDKPRLMIGANYWLRGSMQFFDELDRINA
jgi:hypothetical protein